MTTEKPGKSKNKLLTSTAIIIAVLIVIVAANILIWENRITKSLEITELTNEISNVSQEIQKTPAPSADLQAALAQLGADLNTAQTALPPQFNRNDIIDYIIRLSRECQVEVIPIASQGWTLEKDQPYPVLKLSATLTGSFTQASTFIDRLQRGQYKALVIPELSFTRQAAKVSPDVFSGDNTPVSVKISVSIYAVADKGAK
jgi:hypothetical protein